jgi:putative DNA primase/helicase
VLHRQRDLRRARLDQLPQRAAELVRPLDVGPYRGIRVSPMERLIAYAKGNVRYSGPPGIWLIWNGSLWQQDYGNGMVTLATGAMRLLARQANAQDNESLFKFASKSSNRAGIMNMIALAQKLALLDFGQLDGQPHLIPAQNGVMDISTGEFRPHRKEDYVTRLFPASYSPELGLPQAFLRVLDELMGGGATLVESKTKAEGSTHAASTRGHAAITTRAANKDRRMMEPPGSHRGYTCRRPGKPPTRQEA